MMDEDVLLEERLNALRAQQNTVVKCLLRVVDSKDVNIWRGMLYPPHEVWVRGGRTGFIWSLDDKYSRQYLHYYLGDLASAAATADDVEFWRDGEFVTDHGSTFSLEDFRDGAEDVLGRAVDQETLDLWRSGLSRWNGADVERDVDVTGCTSLQTVVSLQRGDGDGVSLAALFARILSDGDDGAVVSGEKLGLLRIPVFGEATRSHLVARVRKLGWASLIVQAPDHGAREVRIPVADLEEQPSWRNSFDARLSYELCVGRGLPSHVVATAEIEADDDGVTMRTVPISSYTCYIPFRTPSGVRQPSAGPNPWASVEKAVRRALGLYGERPADLSPMTAPPSWAYVQAGDVLDANAVVKEFPPPPKPTPSAPARKDKRAL